MKQTQRHNGIIELVKQQGYVSTEELVEHFSVSPQTIRRDLNELAEQNLILRHHGGAALPSSSVNTPWHDRKATQTEEKERIARKVAEQIPNGSTLFIDIGTTPEAVAHALLNHSNLRIVTNNLNVANTLMVKEDFRTILAGGELRSRDGGIIGEATLDFISQFRLDFGILGISGIDSDGSLLEFEGVRQKPFVSLAAIRRDLEFRHVLNRVLDRVRAHPDSPDPTRRRPTVLRERATRYSQQAC